MTSRNYDFILAVNSAAGFTAGNLIYGVTSGATGLIANVDVAANTLKVKLSNSLQAFTVGETLRSNIISVFTNNVFASYSNGFSTTIGGHAYLINGSTNTFPIPSNTVGRVAKDHLRVYINHQLIPEEFYSYPVSDGFNSNCIQFVTVRVGEDSSFNPSNVTESEKSVYISKIVDTFETVFGTLTTSNGYITASSKAPKRFIPQTAWNLVLNNADIDTGVASFKLPTRYTTNLDIQVISGNPNEKNMLTAYVNTSSITAQASLTSITNSRFIREKNAFEQKPLVRLYSVYYPGEWYPPNANGNPQNDGAGLAWTTGFPYRFAEIRGDIVSDIQYKVHYGSEEYYPYPMDSSGITLDSTGKVNDLTLTLSNFDNLITDLVENPYLCGNVTSNSCQGIVNGELVYGLDPRTVVGNVHFDQDIVDSYYGRVNSAWTYQQAIANGETWQQLKQDTRDMLGGVVEIKTTFANFLNFWPEYSSVQEKYGNTIILASSLPYRVGDVVGINANTISNATITVSEVTDSYIIVSDSSNINTGDNLYIQNPDASTEDYVKDTFKINSLEGLDEKAAKFNLTSWLQYFKLQLPKRKYFKNSCPFTYKGDDGCLYPSSGTGIIPGTTVTANGFFNINNQTVFTLAEDVCAHNYQACVLRKNEQHFGAFIASQLNLG